MNDTLRRFLLSQLRRISWKWPSFGEAKRLARVSRGHYLCAKCGNIYRAKEVQLDHRNPVVPIGGWDGLEGYCNRLFCAVEDLQVLCTTCHNTKTQAENAERRKS